MALKTSPMDVAAIDERIPDSTRRALSRVRQAVVSVPSKGEGTPPS
jgi:hypothetical protein